MQVTQCFRLALTITSWQSLRVCIWHYFLSLNRHLVLFFRRSIGIGDVLQFKCCFWFIKLSLVQWLLLLVWLRVIWTLRDVSSPLRALRSYRHFSKVARHLEFCDDILFKYQFSVWMTIILCTLQFTRLGHTHSTAGWSNTLLAAVLVQGLIGVQLSVKLIETGPGLVFILNYCDEVLHTVVLEFLISHLHRFSARLDRE